MRIIEENGQYTLYKEQGWTVRQFGNLRLRRSGAGGATAAIC